MAQAAFSIQGVARSGHDPIKRYSWQMRFGLNVDSTRKNARAEQQSAEIDISGGFYKVCFT
jgi:hypothetical protein